MDDYDRDSNASSDNEHEQDDITMQDVDDEYDNENDNENDLDNDNDNDNDNENENDDEEDDEQDQHDEEDDAQDQQPNGSAPGANPTVTRTSATPGPLATPKWQPTVRPEYLTAKTYDIVPTMAAPMATSINAMAITPDLRYWMTGGSDGYIRKYDGPSTINGKTLLTVAQRHPFVDSVTKAGVLMSYWENAEPPLHPARQEDLVLSPVYSLAVHSQALWLLSGLESGGINLHSVRHDEGKRITCLQKHSNAVSVLALTPDEKSVLSGSWDKNIFDWDLNTGSVVRQFDGIGQISAIEIRPMGGAPVPPEASEEELPSDTIFSNNSLPGADGDFKFGLDDGFTFDTKPELNGLGTNGVSGQTANGDGLANGPGSPGHDSLFGGSPTGGSDLFGDNDGMGAFGGDDDNEFSRAMMQDSAREADGNIGDFDISGPTFDPDSGPAPAVQPPPDSNQPDSNLFGDSNLNSFEEEINNHNESSTLPPLPDFSVPIAGNSSFPAEHTNMSQSTVLATQGAMPQSPSAVFAAPPPTHHDTTQTSDSTFLSASIDGTLRVWDRRMPNPIARIGNRPGVPPWCMGACWSPDGNWLYAGRRNGTVEEFSIQKARGGRAGWQPERVFKFPGGSGPVSCVRPMINGRHLVCASHDILRLYDLRSDSSSKHSPPPFLIIPGPPRAGVISSLYIEPSSRFMISTAGNRGWEGTTTEVLIGYEINVPQ
ncbi:WD40-repeat-containing domain protein [Biscogniauxia marginata]|nr:WD40-repeat-containing domain protein [Biscogniauxia marginata]